MMSDNAIAISVRVFSDLGSQSLLQAQSTSESFDAL